MVKLSIIIPAYNEERRIGVTLKSYISYFSKRLKNNYEILIVLNGCTDNTLDVVKKFSEKDKKVKYKDIKEAVGKGVAIIEGFKILNGKYIGFVDADNSTMPKAFYDLLLKINDYDGIIASRWIKGAKVKPKQPLLRRIAGRSFNFLLRALFNIRIVDTQCGAKLFKNKAVRDVVRELAITKWAFDVDLLYHLKRKGYKLKEIPTEWHESSGSGLKISRAVPQMFLAVIRLRLIYSPLKFVIDFYDKLPEALKVHHRL